MSRVSVRDRTWARFATVRAAGPLGPPAVESLREVFRELARLDPGHPWLCRVDAARGRLRPVAGGARFYPQFFPNLPHQGQFGHFPPMHVPAGELP
mgnify:CR=1 FL=1